MPPMMVTIDKAGRLVIPKEFRDRLDLTPDTMLEVDMAGDSIRIRPAAAPKRRLEWDEDGRPYFPAVVGHPISDLDVQRLRDADQR